MAVARRHYKDYYHEYYGTGTPVAVAAPVHLARIQEAAKAATAERSGKLAEKEENPDDQVEGVPAKTTSS
jgi:hypothetical protein